MIRRVLTIAVIMACVFALPVRADMGPKPEINISVENFNGELCYATLYSETGGRSPVSFGDWENVPEEIRNRFNGRIDRDGYRYVEDIWIIRETSGILDCRYMTPDRFKLVVYLPETDTFLESAVYDKYGYVCDYSVNVGKTDAAGRLVLKRSVVSVWSVLARLAATLAMELGLAYVFGIREKKAVLLIVAVNILTQAYLNIRLFTGGREFFYLIGLEIEIIVAEMLLYAGLLPRLSGNRIKRGRAVEYSVSANLLSFLVGIVVSFLIGQR